MKEWIKSWSLSNIEIYLFLSKCRHLFGKAQNKGMILPTINLKDILTILSKNRSVFFLQVGSNDGLKNDPLNEFIRDFKWRGIMVEPMPENFNKLINNYQQFGEYLTFENVAISPVTGTYDFYYITGNKDDDKDWYDQVGSFDKDTFYRNISVEPSLSSRVGVRKIPAVTISELTSKHRIEDIDVLHIDTEGYDYKILSTFPFDRYKPAVVLYESEWLSDTENIQALELLKGNGYMLFSYGGDTLGLIKERFYDSNN